MPRIRKFGKRRASKEGYCDSQCPNNSISLDEDSVSEPRPRPTIGEPKINSTKKKLQYLNLCGDNEQYFDTPNNCTKGNIIVDISILSQNICEFAKCKRCSKALSIELFEDVGLLKMRFPESLLF